MMIGNGAEDTVPVVGEPFDSGVGVPSHHRTDSIKPIAFLDGQRAYGHVSSPHQRVRSNEVSAYAAPVPVLCTKLTLTGHGLERPPKADDDSLRLVEERPGGGSSAAA